MILPPEVAAAAQSAQDAAANEQAVTARLVAGPGTGKSRVLTSRAVGLVQSGVADSRIRLLSFTRAATADLDAAMREAWVRSGLPGESGVRVSTVHSLALQILQAANQLAAFPVRPRVLDGWEMENVFDAEYALASGGKPKARRDYIRLDREAFWSTGQSITPGLPSPDPPVTDVERRGFEAYYNERSNLYAYLLPSDITRRCLQYLQASPVDAPLPLQIEHLIVDEYQDLNPVDIELIDEIHRRGPALFVSGDDDQSIYLFRYALPLGLQEFEKKHQDCTTHTLSHCFRCPEEILKPALGPVLSNAPSTRLQKQYVAVPSLATPKVTGSVHRWSFRGSRAEAKAIAASCRLLIDEGMPPDEIVILVSNKRALEAPLEKALTDAKVPVRLADSPPFSETDWGRCALALLRAFCDRDDLVARRVLLGVGRGIGAKTCNDIAAALIAQGVRFVDALAAGPPAGLAARCRTALRQVSQVLTALSVYAKDSTLGEFREEVRAAIQVLRDEADTAAWIQFASTLPDEARAEEVAELLASPTSRKAESGREAIDVRLGLAVESVPVQSVRVMSLHGSKGLTFSVVFIPGFEQGLLPSRRSYGYPGLIQEAARLLFVGMTRARLSVVLSMAECRSINGSLTRQSPSVFAGTLGGRFSTRQSGLSSEEVTSVIAARDALLAE